MRALAGYTRERREESVGEEGGDRRQWKDCCFTLSFIIHTRPVCACTYIKHISTLLKNNEFNVVLDILSEYTKLKMFII